MTLADERARKRGTETLIYTGAPVFGPAWEGVGVRFPRATRLSEGDTVCEVRASIGCYFGFDNTRGPHASLDQQTPDQAYFNWLSQIAAA